MLKIINYITRGKGLGLSILMVIAVIYTISVSLTIKSLVVQFYFPPVLDIAAKVLPVQVENGQVVYPKDTRKEYEILGWSIPFVLDTNVTDFDVNKLKPGFYVSKNKFYYMNRNDIRIWNLRGSFNLPNVDYYDILLSKLNQIILGIVILGSILAFAFLCVVVLAFCGITYIISYFTHKEFQFRTRMRLSVISYTATYILTYLLEMVFYFDSIFIFCVFVIACQYLLMKNILADKK